MNATKMASGITARPDCVTTFDAVKMGSANYVVFEISNDAIVHRENGHCKDWAAFVAILTETSAAYGVFKFDTVAKDKREIQEMVFVSWINDSATTRTKMMYACAREPFKTQLGGGFPVCIQASDMSDLDFDEVKKLVLRGR